jgi:carbonic anhydrase/acetyltransferase-like protein (isoleucine patch superfamily)
MFISIQIGEGFVYLLSVICDFDEVFPVTRFVPGFQKARNSQKVLDLLLSLLENCSEFSDVIQHELSEKIYFCFLALINVETDPNIVSVLQPLMSRMEDGANAGVIARILEERMLKSDEISEDALRLIVPLIPNREKVLHVFETEDCIIIPLEWLNVITGLMEIADATPLALHSVCSSAPSHFASSFCKCTEHGALILDRNMDLDSVVVQPGCVVQEGAVLSKNSMLLSESIALKGSVLCENCYAPRRSVVLSDLPPVAESAVIELPVSLKRGVVIEERAVLSRKCEVGSGTRVCEGACLGCGSQIASGCVILPNAVVPEAVIVPPGFVYSEQVVENSMTIPDLIERFFQAFTRRKTGLVDAKILSNLQRCDFLALVRRYLESIMFLPREAGRQLALCPQVEECFASSEGAEFLYKTFGWTSVLVSLSYWRNGGNGEMIKDLCRLAVMRFDLNFNHLRIGGYASCLLEICEGLEEIVEKGIEREMIDELKEHISKFCDGMCEKLALLGYSSESRLVTCVKKISKVAGIGG